MINEDEKMKKLFVLIGLLVIGTLITAGCIDPNQTTSYSPIGTWDFSEDGCELVIDIENYNSGKMSTYYDNYHYSASDFDLDSLGYRGYVKSIVYGFSLEKTGINDYLVTSVDCYFEMYNGQSSYISEDEGHKIYLGKFTLHSDNYMVYELYNGANAVLHKKQ